MNKDLFIKIFAVAVALVVIANFIGLIIGKVTAKTFWIVIIFCAAAAYWGIPQVRKKFEKK